MAMSGAMEHLLDGENQFFGSSIVYFIFRLMGNIFDIICHIILLDFVCT